MKASLRNKLRYRFERFMAKGGSSIFLSLTIVFVTAFLLILGLRSILMAISPESLVPNSDGTQRTFWQDAYTTWLQMTSTGNMNQDIQSGPLAKFAAIIGGIIGMILLSSLIAFITTSINKLLYEFRKGRGPVLEEDQTLILGWNERVVDIIRELILANESEKTASVVILAEEDKEAMDDQIIKRIPDPKTTKIINSTGDPASLNELIRVNAGLAKSIIILASCSESASPEEKVMSDTQVVKTVMALISMQGGKNELPIIAEMFNEEKRTLLEIFGDDNLITLDSWDIMGKLLVQTSLTSGLEIVYNEIFSFDGGEMYFYEADWGGVKFDNLVYHFEDGIPIGIHGADGSLVLRPEEGTVLKDDDQVLLLAEDDSTIDFKKQALYSPKQLEFSNIKLDKTSKNILILGWHSVAEIFILECDDYLEQAKIDIMFGDPPASIEETINDIKEEVVRFDINLISSPALNYDKLSALDPMSYDSIIILSQDAGEQSADKIDSDTLIILLLLRKIMKEKNITENGPHIITQVLNSENQDLIYQTDVDDFLISNKLITMVLAQLSEQPELKKFYDDIFQEDGSEIYVKPAHLYFKNLPVECTFAEAIKIAQLRDEICMGVRYGALSKSPEKNFGVKLNPNKGSKIKITKDDFLVVLSEDEL